MIAAMTESVDTSSSTRPAQRGRWVRPTAAIVAAVLAFALIPAGVLPILYAIPVIGLLLALGARPDKSAAARPLARSTRNIVIALLIGLAFAVVALQPQLLPVMVTLFDVEQLGLVATLLAVAVMALPLAMAESSTTLGDIPAERPVFTQRNVVLALIVMVTVATWYVTIGQSFVVLALLVLAMPLVLVVSRVWNVVHGRVRMGLRRGSGAGSGPYRLQLLNVLVLCVLLGVAMIPGTYDVLRLDLSAGGYRAFQVAYIAGLVVLVLLAFMPLRRVYLGSNLMVVAGSVFLAVQLVMVYRPASQPVTIGSPLATDWYVGQGGHAELVNYHHVTSTQRDALDILQIVDGRTHRPGSDDLSSYYIFGKPLLAPADGVVTFVVDGHPDQRIGTVDNRHQAGNHVVIDIGRGRFIMMGHLRPGSIRVRVGDRVRAGQEIAQVGNSGNTDQPHLHIQAQNQPSGIDDVTAIPDPGKLLRTLRTYPLLFRGVVLTRDGAASRPAAADPRRGDQVRPAP
jgi:hypothetical protein